MVNSQIEKDPIREDILNGARDLFQRFGFKKTTMEDIARQIGKSKSALYYYYKTKEEIFEAVVLRDMDCQRDLALNVIAEVESAKDKFCLFFTSILQDVRRKANQFSLFRNDFFENPHLIINIAKQREEEVSELIKNLLILGISRGEVKMMSAAEMEVWAKMVNITMRAIGSKLFLDEAFDHMEEHLPFMAEAIFCGVGK